MCVKKVTVAVILILLRKKGHRKLELERESDLMEKSPCPTTFIHELFLFKESAALMSL